MHRVYSQTVKRASSLMAALILLAQMAIPVTVGATPSGKVVICHATDSHNNPYTTNDINTSSVDEDNNQYLNGHGDHTGPVWESGIADHSWGDIIPPFTNPLTGTSFPGQNWTSQGQAIWNNGCKIAVGEITVNKKIDANGNDVYEGANGTANTLGVMWGLDGATPGQTMGSTATGLNHSTHTINENLSAFPDYIFTGWYFTDEKVDGQIDCNNPQGTTLPITLDLSNDHSQEVTLCNQKPSVVPDDGSITIVKNTVGGDGTFDFTGDLGAFSLTTVNGTDSETYSSLDAGTYAVAETVPDDWDLTSATCDDQSPVNAISLQAGESVTCTFTNTKKTPPVVDYCDPSQRPAGVNIDNWVPKDVHCVGLIVAPAEPCGVLGGNVFSKVKGSWGNDYDVVWSEGAADYTKFVSLPTSFPEDYNGGSVTVFYWIVGPEAGYVKGHGIPNFWEQNASSIDVDTDCQDTPPVDVCENIAGIQTTVPDGMVVDKKANCTTPTPDIPTGSITGHKFNDANGNVLREADEETLSGWTIELSRCNDRQLPNLLANLTTPVTGDGTPTVKNCDDLELLDTTVTDSNGQFSFTGLESGTYWVCEVQKDGWVQTYPGEDMCWEVMVDGEECIVDFGNKAKEPGHVLGDTPTPPAKTLANTGSPVIQAVIVSMSILGAASGAAAMSRKQTTGAGK